MQSAKRLQKHDAQQQAAATREEEIGRKNAEREAEEAAAAQRSQLSAAGTIAGQARQAVDAGLTPLKNAADKVASFRTTGGIGLLLVIIAILLFAVVVVNGTGDTRLKQLWYMLNGRASLIGRVTPTSATNTAQSEQQDFADIGAAAAAISADLSLAGIAGGSLFRSLP